MIELENLELWTAVTFVIDLLALVMALTALNRSNDLMYMTQAEVLLLNKKIQDANPSAPATAPAQQEPK